MTSQTILPCTFKDNLCLHCGDTARGECEGWVQYEEVNSLVDEVKRLKAELRLKEVKLEQMRSACKYAISTLYAYEPSIKNFGLLFGAGKDCIKELKVAVGDQK